jgi:hypothetical protein
VGAPFTLSRNPTYHTAGIESVAHITLFHIAAGVPHLFIYQVVDQLGWDWLTVRVYRMNGTTNDVWGNLDAKSFIHGLETYGKAMGIRKYPNPAGRFTWPKPKVGRYAVCLYAYATAQPPRKVPFEVTVCRYVQVAQEPARTR